MKCPTDLGGSRVLGVNGFIFSNEEVPVRCRSDLGENCGDSAESGSSTKREADSLVRVNSGREDIGGSEVMTRSPIGGTTW